MTLRILVVGGLAEMGPWDSFARQLGAELAKAGVGVSLPWTTPFGRALVEGYAKAAPAAAPERVRVHAEDGHPPPSAIAAFAAPPLPGDLAREGASLAEADVVLVAGNGRGMHDLARLAHRRHVPVVPLPIEGTTAEEIWEDALRRPPRPYPDEASRSAFFALRRPDARSAKLATAIAALVQSIAKPVDPPGRPHVLLVHRASTSAGEDDLPTLLARALRQTLPTASIAVAGDGWLRSPGRAFADTISDADLVVADLASAGPTGLYALGWARGAGRAAVPVLRRDHDAGLDARALDTILYESDRELGARLVRKLPAALSAAKPHAETEAAAAIAAGKAAIAAQQKDKREAAARRKEAAAEAARKAREEAAAEGGAKRRRRRGRRGAGKAAASESAGRAPDATPPLAAPASEPEGPADAEPPRDA